MDIVLEGTGACLRDGEGDELIFLVNCLFQWGFILPDRPGFHPLLPVAHRVLGLLD